MNNFSQLANLDAGQVNESELQWDSLSDKERQTLLVMLTSKNDAEAIQRAPVGKTKFYAHKKKLESYKQQLINGVLGKALEVLQAGSIKAAEKLVELLDSPHAKIRQVAAEATEVEKKNKRKTNNNESKILLTIKYYYAPM